MAIDTAMRGAVKHYLLGRVTAAQCIHNNMEETGRSFDYIMGDDGHTLGDDLDGTNSAFLQDCLEMLKDPVPVQYVHREDYHLNLDDKKFLTELHAKAEKTNWKNSEELVRLSADIHKYAP